MNGLSGKGLTRIILEGNDVPTGSREMNEISQLLSCSSEKVLRVASFNSSNADSP